jgi:hypothetical protein
MNRISTVCLASMLASAVLLGSGSAQAAAPAMNGSSVAAEQFTVANWVHGKTADNVGRVQAISSTETTVYIGGNFVQATNHTGKTVRRTYLASVSAATGRLTAWAPTINGQVYALRLSENHRALYVGGQFTTVNGQPRDDFAAFSVRTGQLMPQPGNLHITGGAVRAILPGPDGFYVGGSFTSAGGRPHERMAEFLPRGALISSFRPSFNSDVRALNWSANGLEILAGGWFTQVDNHSAAHLAAIGPVRGLIKPWSTHPAAWVIAMTRDGNALFVAEGGAGGTAARFNATTGAQNWAVRTDGNVQAVAVSPIGQPVFGMHGDCVDNRPNTTFKEGHSCPAGTSTRNKIFMLSAASGALQPWAPSLSSSDSPLGVWAMNSSCHRLYVGGDFIKVGNQMQQRFAIFRES